MKRVKVLALLIAICLVWPVATQQTWMKDRDRLAVSAYAEEEDISDVQFGNDDTSSNKPTKSPSGNKDKNKGNSSLNERQFEKKEKKRGCGVSKRKHIRRCSS